MNSILSIPVSLRQGCSKASVWGRPPVCQFQEPLAPRTPSNSISALAFQKRTFGAIAFFFALILVAGISTTIAATNTAPTSDLETHVMSLLGGANTNHFATPVAPTATPATNTPAVPTSGDIVNLLDDHHKLAIGDRLSFRIIEDEEDPKPMIVADSGEVECPYIGRFPAENKTCKQLANGIKAALEKDYYIEATVIIAVDLMAKTRGRVYLVGALRLPGPQEILSDETLTLSKAVLRSGGFTDFADKKNVKITRKTGPNDTDKQTFVVNVGQIFDNGKVESDISLEPGDLILVPDRKIRF